MNVFVSRSPILPLNFFLDVTRESKLSDDAVKTMFLTNEIIREFIYISSPSLYRVLDKWVDGAIIKNKEKERLKISFLKYISRASSRCTPFGLFAGCSVGEIGDKTDIRLGGIDEFRRKTVLDTRILALIAKKLLEQDKVKTHLIFYPNTSIYHLGQELRYVRSLFVNDQKQHTIVSIKENPFLKEILAKAKNGCKRTSLIELLTNQDIPFNAASKFIDEIIETQLLVSELEVCVTDDQDELLRIISILRQTKHLKELENSLTVINNKLNDLDKQIGNPNKKYLDIKVALEKLLGQKLPEENMFQVDLFPTATKSELAGEIGESVLKGLSILNQLSATESKVELDNFKKSFYRRYERRGVPLAEVLDTDVGIGYGRDDNAGEMNPLIDKIEFVNEDSQKTDLGELTLNEFHQFLNGKIISALKANEDTILLVEKELQVFERNNITLSDSIYSTFSVIKCESGQTKILLKGGGGTSAANLITRFAKAEKNLLEIVKEIVQHEQNINQDKILAEISHMPESKLMGNVLKRPSLRSFEIPYLTQPSVSSQNRISLSDLELSMANGKRLDLTWKKTKSTVSPKLTSAHNFWSSGSLPVYHFLCDLQRQDIKTGINLPIGPLVNIYDYIPRIELNDVILREATWKFKKDDIAHLIEVKDDEDCLLRAAEEFTIKNEVPKLVKYVERDKGFLVNFQNSTSIKTLLDSVKGRNFFFLKEYINPGNVVVDNKTNATYSNEIVLFFLKDQLKG